jgi:hypothetical protein
MEEEISASSRSPSRPRSAASPAAAAARPEDVWLCACLCAGAVARCLSGVWASVCGGARRTDTRPRPSLQPWRVSVCVCPCVGVCLECVGVCVCGGARRRDHAALLPFTAGMVDAHAPDRQTPTRQTDTAPPHPHTDTRTAMHPKVLLRTALEFRCLISHRRCDQAASVCVWGMDGISRKPRHEAATVSDSGVSECIG